MRARRVLTNARAESNNTDRARGRTSPLTHLLRAGLTFGAVFAVGTTACSTAEKPDPLDEARLLVIDREPALRVLERISLLEGAPAGRVGEALLSSLSTDPALKRCVTLVISFPDEAHESEASATSSAEEAFAPRCAGEASHSVTVDTAIERRGKQDALLAWRVGLDGRAEISLEVDPAGGVRATGFLIAPSAPGALALLIPSAEPPEPSVIAATVPWLRAQFRPRDGLKLSSWIPTGGQADRLFALKGRLLEGALFRGTWEFAFLPPANGGEIPIAIAAIHHRSRSGIDAALGEALDQLESTWPIRRSPHPFTSADGSTLEGGCYFDLPILPELAPCWVVTPKALLIGYRAEGLEAVLGLPNVTAPAQSTPESSLPTDGSAAHGGFEIDLARLARIDHLRLGDSAAAQLGDVFRRFAVSLSPASSSAASLPDRAGDANTYVIEAKLDAQENAAL